MYISLVYFWKEYCTTKGRNASHYTTYLHLFFEVRFSLRNGHSKSHADGLLVCIQSFRIMTGKHTLNNCIRFKIGLKKALIPFVLTPTIHGYIR